MTRLPAVSTILYLALLAAFGLAVGGLAQLILPGKDNLGLVGTFFIGIAGGFTGGLLVWAISGDRFWGGFVASVVAAAGLIYLLRKLDGGGLRDPG